MDGRVMSEDIFNVFMLLEQIYEQSQQRWQLNDVVLAKFMQSIICSGLKYNEASESNFVLHATS